MSPWSSWPSSLNLSSVQNTANTMSRRVQFEDIPKKQPKASSKSPKAKPEKREREHSSSGPSVTSSMAVNPHDKRRIHKGPYPYPVLRDEPAPPSTSKQVPLSSSQSKHKTTPAAPAPLSKPRQVPSSSSQSKAKTSTALVKPKSSFQHSSVSQPKSEAANSG